MNIKKTVILFCKGVIIGIAAPIPGISAGTLAFILGVYEEIAAAAALIPTLLLKPKKLLEPLKVIVPVFGGAIVAAILFFNIITYLFANFPVPTKIFFTGLILGSLPLVTRSVSVFGIKTFLSFFVGAFVMAVFVYLNINNPQIGGPSYTGFTILYGIKMFVYGMLAGVAGVIPGISGSMVLLVLGEYENVSFLANAHEYLPLTFLGVGMIIGIFGFAKIITIMFARYKDIIFAWVLGVIIVSLLNIWPVISDLSIFGVAASVLSLCVGFSLSLVMERIEKSRQ